MKKLLVGAVIGGALVYVITKLHREGKLDNLYDGVNDLASKAKLNLKNLADAGVNQAEYIKDRIDYEMKKD